MVSLVHDEELTMLRYFSLVALIDARKGPLTVGDDGGFGPAPNRAAASLKIFDAKDPANSGAVSYGALVVFEASTFDPVRRRRVRRRSDPWLVQGAEGAAKGAVPETGKIALFPTKRTRASGFQVRDALVVTLRLVEAPASAIRDGEATGDTETTDTSGTGGDGATSPTDTSGTSGTTGTSASGGTTSTTTSAGTGTTTTSTGGSGGDDDVPFIGEIRMFAGNYAPRGWALCDGQLLPIAQHTALFSILGTSYGGDGMTTFGLPDLRGRFAMHAGNGPGLTPRPLGAAGGAETVAPSQPEMSHHTHAVSGLEVSDRLPDPSGPTAGPSDTGRLVVSSPGTVTPAIAIGPTGGDIPQSNMPPFRTVNYIIATEGLFPARA